jgi:hypothetical protein
MFEKCRACGARLAATALLCLTCGTSTAALPVDAAAVLAPPHHVAVMAMPPGESDSPHAPDEWPTDHIGSSASSAGGGTIQGAAQLSGEGHLTAGGVTHRAGSSVLSGSGTLAAG